MAHEEVVITDPDDSRVADYVGLTDAALRRRFESPEGAAASPHGRFITEGLLALEALLSSPYHLRSILVAQAQLDRVRPLLSATPDTCLYVAAQEVVDEVVGFRIHRGVVASADRLALPAPIDLMRSLEVDGPRPRRIAVLEGLNDHENLGVLFRNAAAFGIDAVLLDPRCADPLYRRTVRVSLGHVLHVPFARFEPSDWPAPALGEVQALGYQVLALSPHPSGEPLAAVDPAANRLAWLLGAEGPGLSDATLAAADGRVRIDIETSVDSLNVATAAAIAFHWSRSATTRRQANR